MKLRELLPEKAYSEALVDTFIHSRDGSDYAGVCTAVVWPTTKEDLISLLKFGTSKEVHFTIRGAATNTMGGCVPAQAVVVNMERMNKIVEWGSDFVVVEAGVILGELLHVLKKKRLFFPIVPVEFPVCTIGGMVATNTSGLDTSYGKMEDWVTEIDAIDGKGNRVHATGPMLNDFLGMEGTTGIVYRVKLKFLSEPRKKTVTLFKFNTLTALMDKVYIVDKNHSVIAVEYFDEFCSRVLGLGDAAHLLVEYKNDSGLIKNMEEIVQLEALKEKLHHILADKKYTQKEDPKIPLEQTAKFLHWLQKNGVPCFGHMKLRILHPCFREGSRLPQEMYALVKTIGGDIVGQYGVGVLRRKFLKEEKRARVVSLKNTYDPEKRLNTGVLIA